MNEVDIHIGGVINYNDLLILWELATERALLDCRTGDTLEQFLEIAKTTNIPLHFHDDWPGDEALEDIQSFCIERELCYRQILTTRDSSIENICIFNGTVTLQSTCRAGRTMLVDLDDLQAMRNSGTTSLDDVLNAYAVFNRNIPPLRVVHSTRERLDALASQPAW